MIFECTHYGLIVCAASWLAPEANLLQPAEWTIDEPTAVVAPAASQAPKLEAREAIKRVMPAHVRVSVARRPEAADPRIPESGEVPVEVVSGILFDSSGFIVTVAEPLVHADTICVDTYTGNPSAATIVGYDTMTNIGVLKIDPIDLKLPEFTSSLDLEAGAGLLSIGNPYNLGPAATLGYVAAVDREVKIGEHDWRHVLQVSMPVNEGDQGGPVADTDGRVVAMLLTTLRQDAARGMTAPPQGVSFAVPMERALPTARAIRKLWEASQEATDGAGRAEDRPWLGVRGRDIQDATLRRHLRLEDGVGVLIERVFRNSPAETGGLVADDVIVGFGGEPVRGSSDLGERIANAKPGSMITIELIRAGDTRSVTLTVGSM